METNISAEKIYEYLKRKNLIIFEAIVGSQAYGTNLPESDIDKKFLYVLPDYLQGYIPQIHVNKDYVGFEIGEFLKLIKTNNPTMMELLNIPYDCIVYKNDAFDLILNNKEKFITKKCAQSFGSYAKAQIIKANGQDKMVNWEKDKVMRKTPIDFCFVIEGYKTTPLKKFLSKHNYEQKFCGVANINNAKDLYALFYDMTAHSCFSEQIDSITRETNKKNAMHLFGEFGKGYKGIEKEDEMGKGGVSNSIRLSSIPKGETPICVFSYNMNAYMTHCKDYNKYQDWIKKRNKARWIDVKTHGQKIDGKNMLHCMRLIEMAIDIAEGKGVVVRRENAKELIDIRKGNVDLETLIKTAEIKIKKMDELFAKSNLPKNISDDFIAEIEKNIRIESLKNFNYEY